MMRRVFAAALVSLACVAQAQMQAPVAIAPGVTLIPGGFLPGRQPDGNTVVFDAPAGLIVVDTGRHEWHRHAILAYARERQRPIAAIVNSHWHLDHTSGNEAIKAAYPQAKVYASTAVERIIRELWPASIVRLRGYLAKGHPELHPDDIRSDLHAEEHPHAMRPDVPVTADATQEVAGLPLELHVAAHAATDADVWVFDPRSGVLAAGDLVTYPVPFLDTACIAGWLAALKQVQDRPFKLLVPGHGPVLDRARFAAYRGAMENYAACIRSDTDKARCGARWFEDIGQAPDERDREFAEGYVDFLRRSGGNAPQCRAPS